LGTVPQAYYQFVVDYAPYVYFIPGSGLDLATGKAVLAASFAIDFLCEAYSAEQFESNKTVIHNKVVELADWILTQQCTDPAKKAYGGFQSAETSTYYYSVDACRAIPSLLKAYEVTGDADYLNAAELAGATFLKAMQDEQTYGGFARSATIDGVFALQMDVECLYGLMGLRMLAETYDTANATTYQSMMSKAVDFLREGIENLWLYYDPADSSWHRLGLAENEVYDDPLAYALLGLYDYEGWSLSCQKLYNFINSIKASAQYSAYNPAICWAGYIDVVSRFPTCDYYDVVTTGILWKIRRDRDKSCFAFSMKIVDKHQSEFMFWGVKHSDYSYVENKQAMATVCWLSQLFLNYQEPLTPFTRFLRARSENIQMYSVREASEQVTYGEAVDILAIVSPVRTEEVFMEPGYLINDYVTVYTFAPLRHHDKIRRKGEDYMVLGVQAFNFAGETAYFKANCRRLLGQ
jgi:hypothetical protein